jgi:hypothetical protein
MPKHPWPQTTGLQSNKEIQMSILTTTASFAAAALFAAYGLGQVISKSIETEIEIAAPASAVWQALRDFEDYAAWNPFIQSISGEMAVGARLAISVGLGANSMNFSPTVLRSEDNREFRWIGQLGMPGIFDGEHYFILEETAGGTTVLRHGEVFNGMLAAILFPMLQDDTRTGFNAMNVALRDLVEIQS